MTRARDIADLAGGGTLLTRQLFTATAGQTTFTPSAGYNPGALEVFMNGLMLLASDYTATNSSTVVLGVAANAGDEVEILTYQINTIGDTVSASNGGTFNSSVLVGKSVDTLATSGTVLFANGQVDASVDSNYVAKFNRKSSDGTIIELRKDTTGIVGSIGTSGGDLIISGRTSSAKSGIRFDNNTITPALNGADVDASVDLGYSSRRFKDAYLSGGIHLGGTGSANKLDDYEEGTWTPAVYQAGFTISSGFTARYTKIGRLVTVICDCNLSGTGNGNDMKISGLPFTSLSAGHASGAGYTQVYPSAQNGSNAAFVPKSGNNDTFVYFQNGNGARYDGDRFSAGFLNFTITYFTS